MKIMRSNAALVAAAGLFFLAGAARADFIDMWADKNDMPAHKAPRTGHSNVVVIPVQINYAGAAGAYSPVDLAQLKTFFGSTVAHDKFSFAGFLSAASGGKYAAAVTVAPVVIYDGCPAMLAVSGDCTIARGSVPALASGVDFVRDVFRRAHDEGHVDFSQFDVNGLGGAADGTIDGAMIVVNVPGVGVTLPIYAVNGGSNLAGGTGGPLILDGVKIPYVAIGGSRLISGTQHLETIVVHEFLHVLGLADLYYEHPSSGDQYPQWAGLHYSTMGDWDYDLAATLPDAESRRALAWVDTHVVSGRQTLTLAPAGAGGAVVKLGMMTGGRKEYFLAEVRGPSGAYDASVTDVNGNPTWGLAVYHVDWSKGPKAESGLFTSRLIDCLDCDPWHPFLRNVESSNQFGLIYQGPMDPDASSIGGVTDDKVLWQSGATFASVSNAGMLSGQNRYTGSNWYDGTPSGILIENITVNPDHTVTATFTADTVADACADVQCGPLEVCVASGARAGTCDPSSELDGGLPLHVPDLTQSSGCETSGGTTGVAWSLLPLGLLAAALARRRSSRI